MGLNFIGGHIIQCDEPGCDATIIFNYCRTYEIVDSAKRRGWDIKPGNPVIYCPKHSRDKNSSYNEKKESEYKPEES